MSSGVSSSMSAWHPVPDRGVRCRHRQGPRHHWRQPHRGGLCDVPGRLVRHRRVSGDVARDVRQPQHASFRRRGPPGGGAMRHHRRSGREGQVRRSRLHGDAGGLPARCQPPHHLPLHAEACLMDQSDRDLVLYPGAQAAPPWQLHVQGASQAADRGVHRLLQPDHGQALPLDHEGSASHRVKPAKRGSDFRRGVLDTSATVPPTASSAAAATSDGGDGASASAAPSPASPAPTAVPPSVSTGDITQQIMTRVTASLELKPPSFAAPALPDSAPTGPQAAVPSQPAAAAPPAAPSAAPAVSSAPSPSSSVPPSDPVQIAAALRPSPMTPQDQVQVLELVTQMATMVRDLKKESAQMRADFARSQADEAARMSDWERRLALAEARSAMLAADAAGSAPFVATAPPETVRVSTTSSPTTAVVPAGDAGKKYRLQAASPGLAMLAEIDRGGGEGAQIQTS